MFSSLSENLGKVFDKLRGKGFISDDDVNTAMREIRLALLEADVSLPIVKQFIETVKTQALGAELIKSVTPGQLIVKIVSDELENMLRSDNQQLNLATATPAVIMMVGLQGSGKTTTSAKLALHLKKKLNKKPLLVSPDTYRPAAQLQLENLAQQIDTLSLDIVKDQQPLDIAKRALKEAALRQVDVVILDTAGRLHTDQELMDELRGVKKIASPIEVLLVADALTGQDAVNIAKEFHEQVGVTGIVLTRIDGDARGGAALSMRLATDCPIKFMGVGEKIADFEEFYADRIASRILGMGDVVSLVEKAKEAISEDEAERIQARLMKGIFNMNDLLAQFKNLRKIGGIEKVAGFIPGLGKIKNMISEANIDSKMIGRQEAIILSMTFKERRNPFLINAARKKRIAAGSGTRVEDVNKLLKQYMTMSKMLKKFGKMSPSEMEKLGGMFNMK